MIVRLNWEAMADAVVEARNKDNLALGGEAALNILRCEIRENVMDRGPYVYHFLGEDGWADDRRACISEGPIVLVMCRQSDVGKLFSAVQRITKLTTKELELGIWGVKVPEGADFETLYFDSLLRSHRGGTNYAKTYKQMILYQDTLKGCGFDIKEIDSTGGKS